MGEKNAVEAEDDRRDMESVADGGRGADGGAEVRETVGKARRDTVELFALVGHNARLRRWFCWRCLPVQYHRCPVFREIDISLDDVDPRAADYISAEERYLADLHADHIDAEERMLNTTPSGTKPTLGGS